MADTMADTNKAEKGDEPMPQADEAADEEMSQAKAATTHTVPWVEKYRPQSLDDIFSHKDIVATRTSIFSLMGQSRLTRLVRSVS